MKQYSIVAMAKQPVAIPDPLIMLDTGHNVFQVMTEDITEVLDLLENEGVTVQSYNKLGQDEAPRLEDELLPGETLASIGIL